MSDRNRDTAPPPAAGRVSRVGVPPARPKLPSYRGGDDEGSADREYMLKVFRDMEHRLADKIAEVRVEAVEEAKRSMRPPAKSEPPKATHWLSTIPAILVAVAGLVTAIAALRREPDTTKDEQSYKTLSEAVNKQAADLAARAKTDEERWKFTIGLFKRIPGITIVEAPGQEPIEPIDILPPPRSRAPKPPTAAPTIQVREPLPAPAPSVSAVKLPSPEKLFGDKKP